MIESSQQMISVSGVKAREGKLILVVALFGFILSITQILGDSPDYVDYEAFFEIIREVKWGMFGQTRFEPGFVAVSILLTSLFNSEVFVYSCIVFFAMLLKSWAIDFYSKSYQIFVLIVIYYFFRYFSLHELTQLRAACAIALLLVAVVAIWNNHIRYGVLFCFFSLLFQVSTAAVIPALFLRSYTRWRTISIGIGVFLCTYIYASFVASYLASYIAGLNSYSVQGYSVVAPNPFAVQLLIDWAMVIYSLAVWERLTPLMRRVILLELIGLAFFYGSLELGVIAHRVREIYSVFWIFFLIEGLQKRETKLMCYGFFVVCLIWYSYLFVFSGKFFDARDLYM